MKPLEVADEIIDGVALGELVSLSRLLIGFDYAFKRRKRLIVNSGDAEYYFFALSFGYLPFVIIEIILDSLVLLVQREIAFADAFF